MWDFSLLRASFYITDEFLLIFSRSYVCHVPMCAYLLQVVNRPTADFEIGHSLMTLLVSARGRNEHAQLNLGIQLVSSSPPIPSLLYARFPWCFFFSSDWLTFAKFFPAFLWNKVLLREGDVDSSKRRPSALFRLSSCHSIFGSTHAMGLLQEKFNFREAGTE